MGSHNSVRSVDRIFTTARPLTRRQIVAVPQREGITQMASDDSHALEISQKASGKFTDHSVAVPDRTATWCGCTPR